MAPPLLRDVLLLNVLLVTVNVPRPCHAERGVDPTLDAGGGQEADAADCAVDEYRGGGAGENLTCRHHAGELDCAQQGGQEGGVWFAVFAEPLSPDYS